MEIDSSQCGCGGSSVSDASENGSDIDAVPAMCAKEVPQAQLLFSDMPLMGYITVGFLILFALIVLASYLEQVYFIMSRFQSHFRQTRTIWILSVYPVFSCCSLLGAFVPRAGPLTDMVSSVYLASCLYNFSRLMVDYLGGRENALRIIDEGRPLKMNTPPCCCCCICLPPIKFKRNVYTRIKILVMQVTIVHPLIMFIAAILWANGDFLYGTLTPYTFYPIITVINTTSTLMAVYGLMLFQRVFRAELEQRYLITGKIISIQLTLLTSDLPNTILIILVASRVITCTQLFPASTRAQEMYHILLVTMMLPLSIMGRIFFRRKDDGIVETQQQPPTLCSNCLSAEHQSPNHQSLQLMSMYQYNVAKLESSHSEDEQLTEVDSEGCEQFGLQSEV